MSNKIDEAANKIEKANAELFFIRALRNRSNQKAVLLLNKAASNNPNSANIFALRSIKFSSIGDFSKAEEDCNRANQIEPDNIFWLKARALIEINKENYAEAISLLKKFVNQVASTINEWQNTGLRIGSTRFSLQKKYVSREDLAQAGYLLAICYKNLDDYETTLYCLEQADRYNSDKYLSDQVESLRNDVNQRIHEIRQELEATPGYKIRNFVRVLIAFPAWIFISLINHALYFVILGILSVPLSIAVQTSTNMSYEGIYYGEGDPQSASGIILVAGMLCLFYGFYMLWYRARHKSSFECFPIPLFEDICKKTTGLSIFEVISSDGERFL